MINIDREKTHSQWIQLLPKVDERLHLSVKLCKQVLQELSGGEVRYDEIVLRNYFSSVFACEYSISFLSLSLSFLSFCLSVFLSSFFFDVQTTHPSVSGTAVPSAVNANIEAQNVLSFRPVVLISDRTRSNDLEVMEGRCQGNKFLKNLEIIKICEGSNKAIEKQQIR